MCNNIYLILFICLPLAAFSQDVAFSNLFSLSEKESEGFETVPFMNGYLLLAHSFCDGIECFQLVKTDNTGSIEWKKQYADTVPISVGQYGLLVKNNLIYVSGTTIGSTINEWLPFITCMNETGDVLWSKILNLNYKHFTQGLLKTSGNEFIIYGYVIQSNQAESLSLISVDVTGNLIWNKKHPIVNNHISGLKADIFYNDKIVMVYHVCLTDCAFDNAAVVKLDANGEEIWTRYYNVGYFAETCSILALADGKMAFSWVEENTDSLMYQSYPYYVSFLDSMGNKEHKYTFYRQYQTNIWNLQKGFDNEEVIAFGETWYPGDPIDNWYPNCGLISCISTGGKLKWEYSIADLRFPPYYGALRSGFFGMDSSIISTGFIYNIQSNGSLKRNTWLLKLKPPFCMDDFCKDSFLLITSTQSANINSKIDIFPNPATNYITITHALIGPVAFDLYNMLGQFIWSTNLEKHVNTQVRVGLPSTLNPGSYLVRLMSLQNGQTASRILIIKP